MSKTIAILDANILYPAVLRDLFMELAVQGCFQAKWSDKINDEWINSLLRKEPQRDISKLIRTKNKMNQAILDSVVEDFDHIIPTLHLPDDDDRHVLAAAIKSNSDYIVTNNLKDFPDSELEKYGVAKISPDDFALMIFGNNRIEFETSIIRIMARLKNPPMEYEDYLLKLRKQGLNKTVDALQAI